MIHSRRLTIDEYGMALAWVASLRSTCPRGQCGGVILEAGRVVATGYNGAPPDLAHCLDAGCVMREVRGRQRCVRAQHAEANAILQARGRGDTIYTVAMPCLDCLRDILTAGLKRVVYAFPYDDPARDELLNEIRDAGVKLQLTQLGIPYLHQG